MDAILEFCDDWFFDKTYAYLLPHPQTPSILSAASSSSSSSSSSSIINSTVTSILASAGANGSHSSLPSLAHDSSLSPTSLLPRDSMLRQCMSLYAVALIGAMLLYYFFCSVSYFFFFDRRLEHHPRFLKNQIRMEIKSSMIAAPWIDLFTLPWFLGEVRGKSKLYSNVEEYGWSYLVASVVGFMFFTDFCIYWIHRLEHHPSIYKYVHKPHHKWIMPTPWAALAFHPVDGYAQSLPYHIFVYLFPMHRTVYMCLFVFVQVWTILIHDGDMISDHFFEKYINSPAHHTLHHLYFTCNYGQYFTWADSYFDSYRPPAPELDPLLDSLKMMKKKGLIDEAGNPIPQNKSKSKKQD